MPYVLEVVMRTVYLSLGANIGNRRLNIEKALQQLAQHPQIKMKTISRIIETEPYGVHTQPCFINCTLKVTTGLSAIQLLKECQSIEASLGRKRDMRWGPRTIDIDILFYDDQIIETEELLIPHPGIRDRVYLLSSLNELCPDFFHPLLHRTIRDLLRIKTESLFFRL